MESSLNLALPLTPSQGPYPLIPPRELQISPCLKAGLKRPLQMEGVCAVAPARLPSEFLLVEGRKESCQPLKSERKKGLFKRLKVTRIRARGIRLQRQMGYQANFLDSSPSTHTHHQVQCPVWTGASLLHPSELRMFSDHQHSHSCYGFTLNWSHALI